MWIKALEKAATGAVGPVTINFDEFFDALGMERDSSYTGSELNKFYRKAALKNHPDKGGDVEAVSILSTRSISSNPTPLVSTRAFFHNTAYSVPPVLILALNFPCLFINLYLLLYK